MTIHELQQKVNNYDDLCKDFKTLYQSCMNAIESLSEIDLLDLINSKDYGPAKYLNGNGLWSNEKKISIYSSNNPDEVITDVAPDHSRLQCINEFSISVAHEKNPQITFSGCISLELLKRYPNCLFSRGTVKENLENLFGDALISVSIESDYTNLQEALNKGEVELVFCFSVAEEWFLNS